MRIVVLTLLALVSAALCIRAESTGTRRDVYIFKPLTMVWIIMIALLEKNPVPSSYKYLILAGLVCSLMGDIFLMLPSDRFIPGLLSFLFAHLFYIAAFSSGKPQLYALWYAIPFLVYGGVMLWLLFPHLGRMKLPVIIYMLVILVMAWRALNMWRETEQVWSELAFFGALLFTVSDSILALNRFRGRIDYSEFYILSTYFTAQWLIALSV
ncbi:MAG TPA: lysoplasmalogenase [Pyrinomonadaceae bacterium]